MFLYGKKFYLRLDFIITQQIGRRGSQLSITLHFFKAVVASQKGIPGLGKA